MKTLGIIGGFGPQATADFYISFIRACRKSVLSHQPHIIVWNVPVPQKFEDDLLLRGVGEKRFKPLLIEAATSLEKFGAGAIVLPCNTLHVFAKDIQEAISVPLINIVDACIEKFNEDNITKIGLLGTGSTIKNRLFFDPSDTIDFIPPNKNLQNQLDKGFHDRVVHGHPHLLKKAVLLAVQQFTKKGIHDILLASTDLHEELQPAPAICIHDTLDILVRATVSVI